MLNSLTQHLKCVLNHSVLTENKMIYNIWILIFGDPLNGIFHEHLTVKRKDITWCSPLSYDIYHADLVLLYNLYLMFENKIIFDASLFKSVYFLQSPLTLRPQNFKTIFSSCQIAPDDHLLNERTLINCKKKENMYLQQYYRPADWRSTCSHQGLHWRQYLC